MVVSWPHEYRDRRSCGNRRIFEFERNLYDIWKKKSSSMTSGRSGVLFVAVSSPWHGLCLCGMWIDGILMEVCIENLVQQVVVVEHDVVDGEFDFRSNINLHTWFGLVSLKMQMHVGGCTTANIASSVAHFRS